MDLQSILQQLLGAKPGYAADDPRSNPNFEDRTARRHPGSMAQQEDIRRNVAEMQLRSGDADAQGNRERIEDWLGATDPKREPFNPIAELDAARKEGYAPAPEAPKDWGALKGITDHLFGGPSPQVSPEAGVAMPGQAPLPPPRPPYNPFDPAMHDTQPAAPDPRGQGPQPILPPGPKDQNRLGSPSPKEHGRLLDQLFGEAAATPSIPQGDTEATDPGDLALLAKMGVKGTDLPRLGVPRLPQHLHMDDSMKAPAKLDQSNPNRYSASAVAGDPSSPIAEFFRQQARMALGDPQAALLEQLKDGSGDVR
jgi:hypothetical protein